MHQIATFLHRGARIARRASLLASPALLLRLAACTNTAGPGLDAPASYAALAGVWNELPVQQSGELPAPMTPNPVTADYRIVVHYSPASLPPTAQWCASPSATADTEPTINVPDPISPTVIEVGAALCHHNALVTTAEGRVPLGSRTLAQRQQDVSFITQQLLNQLDPSSREDLSGG